MKVGSTSGAIRYVGCGGDAGCIERRTINVSAAYFLSIEFQQTGGLVDGLYRASYGRRPLYAEFMPDTAVPWPERGGGQHLTGKRSCWSQQAGVHQCLGAASGVPVRLMAD